MTKTELQMTTTMRKLEYEKHAQQRPLFRFVIWISFVMRQSCLVVLFHSFLIRHLAFVIFSKISATEQV